MLKASENPPMLSGAAEKPSELAGIWWVAHTKARAEKALAWDLAARGISYFLPLAERTVYWGRRKRRILTPVFPSYLFLCGDQRARQGCFETNRICQVLEVKLREQLIGELDDLHSALQNGAKIDLYPRPAKGTRWRVAKGPLEGVEGVVVRERDGLRLVLEISMLGRGAALEISADLLEPAD